MRVLCRSLGGELPAPNGRSKATVTLNRLIRVQIFVEVHGTSRFTCSYNCRTAVISRMTMLMAQFELLEAARFHYPYPRSARPCILFPAVTDPYFEQKHAKYRTGFCTYQNNKANGLHSGMQASLAAHGAHASPDNEQQKCYLLCAPTHNGCKFLPLVGSWSCLPRLGQVA